MQCSSYAALALHTLASAGLDLMGPSGVQAMSYHSSEHIPCSCVGKPSNQRCSEVAARQQEPHTRVNTECLLTALVPQRCWVLDLSLCYRVQQCSVVGATI
eukprot:jgi/Ulvmu1/320/UM001_0324.1